MKRTGESVYVQRLRLKNAQRDSLRVHVEPWGEELLISPNACYGIIAEGPAGDCLEVEVAEGRITVYGWPGSVVSVFEKRRLVCECRIPAPATPGPERD